MRRGSFKSSQTEETVSRGVTTAVFACIIVMVMLLCSCGLYSYPYIYAPSLKGGTAGTAQNYVHIVHNGENDPSVFRGYEIYYKFYASTTAGTQWYNDNKSIFSVKEPDYSALTAAGYRRCRTKKLYKEDTTYPMFPVPTDDRDDDFTLVIDFYPITDMNYTKVELAMNYLSDSHPFYRAVKDQHPDSGEAESAGGKPGDELYKDFNIDDIEYESYQDSDLPSGEVTLSLYIIGYGQHENHNLYSKPVWLGNVECWH